MPAVDQPLVEVDRREVDKMLLFHLPTMAWSLAATLPSFIKLTQDKQLYKKRGQMNTMKYSYTKERGNSVPIRTKISPTKNKLIYK